MAATIYKLEIQAVGNNEFNTVLTQGTAVSPLGGNTSLLVKDIKFNAQMYSPNSLEIVVSSIGIDLESYTDIKLSLYKTSTDKQIYAAQNYYVVEKKFMVTSESASQKEYTLKAYSADFFLTIDKFCQAFTGKTLINGIISPTLSNSVSKNFNLFRSLTANTKNENLVVNLQNFSKDSIIPYAVQYNESFYDFMVRMCNRDGEFLYFGSDNKLHIGLEKKEGELIDTYSAEFIQTYNTEDTTNWVEPDYLGRFKSGDLSNIEDDNAKTEAREKFNYIKNFNNSNNNDDSNLSSYSCILSPEYLENLEQSADYRGDYATKDDYFAWFSEITASLSTFAQEPTVLDSVATWSKYIADRWIHIKSWIDGINTKFDKKFSVYKKEEPDKTISKYLYSDGTRTNAIYNDIYKKLEKAQTHQVRINVTGESFPELGSIVKFNNESYVVYKLEVKFINKNDNTSQNAEEYNQEYKLLLVKCDSDTNYPLPMPEKRFCKSSAQRAIVKDNFDPSRLGRVRVKFPWQKETDTDDEKGNNWTPWIRVSTPMASDGAGFLFTPAINDEVLVDFENGNIEYPYVIGAFYNDTNKPSVASQSQTHGKVKSITSANGHHISFTDNGGLERYMANFLPLSKYITSYGNSDQKTFKGEYAKYFGGGFEISDYYGIYSISGSSHNRSIDISSPYGKVSIDAFQGITINAPLGDVKIVGKNVSIEARNNLKLESGTNISGYFQNEDNYLKIPDAILSNVSSTVGFDLSFIRNYVEIFFRPIGGTMLIKSNRYMRLEAGDGNTKPNDSIKGISGTLTSSMFPQKTKLSKAAKEVVEVYDRIKDWCDSYNNFITRFDQFRQTPGYTDLSLLNNGEIKPLNDLVNNNTPNDIRVQISALRMGLIALERTKEELDYEDVSGLPSLNEINRQWNNLKTIEFPLKKRVVYENLKRVVDNDVSIFGKIVVEKLPSHGFPDRLDNYVKIIDKPTEIGFNQRRNVFGAGGFIDLKDDKTWESNDKGAILFSDKSESYYKMGNNGDLIKGFNYDYRDEFVSIIDSIGEN